MEVSTTVQQLCSIRTFHSCLDFTHLHIFRVPYEPFHSDKRDGKQLRKKSLKLCVRVHVRELFFIHSRTQRHRLGAFLTLLWESCDQYQLFISEPRCDFFWFPLFPLIDSKSNTTCHLLNRGALDRLLHWITDCSS